MRVGDSYIYHGIPLYFFPVTILLLPLLLLPIKTDFLVKYDMCGVFVVCLLAVSSPSRMIGQRDTSWHVQ